MGRPTKIFFDGGLRPTGMETAVVVRGREHVRRHPGAGTSTHAEWLALLDALRIARELGIPDAVFLGDSAIVVGQATGSVRARGGDGADRAAFDALLDGAPVPRIRHVKRAQNLAGIALARLHPR